MRIARKGAGKVGLPEVSLGVLPGTGGTQRLVRIVGKARAIELMAEGTTFDFETAQQLGLVNKVIEADSRDDFLAKVLEYAAQFTTPNKATKAVGPHQAFGADGLRAPLRAGARRSSASFSSSSSPAQDAKEGLAAYIEKRPAQFKGR